LFVGEQEAG